MHKIILSLGSNVGDRATNLSNAIKLMCDRGMLWNTVVSDIFENPAMVLDNSPIEWSMDFFNIALIGDTIMSPMEFFSAMKQIEKECGRSSGPKWSPRVIDIDILFYDDLVLDSDICTIPHKSVLEREFVMFPLSQIAKDYKYPRSGDFYNKTIEEIYKVKFSSFSIAK